MLYSLPGLLFLGDRVLTAAIRGGLLSPGNNTIMGFPWDFKRTIEEGTEIAVHPRQWWVIQLTQSGKGKSS